MVKVMNSIEQYSQFRNTHLSVTRKMEDRCFTQSQFYGVSDTVPNLTSLRGDVRRYREEIVNQALSDPIFARANRVFLARALRLPEALITPLNWKTRSLKVLGLFFPTMVRANIAKKILENVRAYESREFLFRKYFVFSNSWISSSSSWNSYSNSLDYALVKIPASHDSLSFDELRNIDIHWLKLAHRLGSKNWSDVQMALKGHDRFRPAEFEALLVEEGVIKSIDELTWLSSRSKERSFNGPSKARDLPAAADLMKQLIDNGVSRELIAKTLLATSSNFNAVALSEKFDLLREYSIDIDAAFAQLGSLLWKTSYEKLRFLICGIGFSKAEHLLAFREYLGAGYEVDELFFRRYRQLGAGPDDFVLAQKLLMKVSRAESSSHCVAALELLMGQPYCIPPNQLVHCENYILSKGRLSEYLELLSRHGLTSTDDILCFQDAFSYLHSSLVEHLFSLAIPRCNGSDNRSVCRWIVDATRSGYIEVFEYLVVKLNVRTLSELENILKFARVNLTILKFAVEERGFSTLKKLTHWYYRNATGIHDISLPTSLGSVDRLLLEYAFVTHRFSALPKNREVVESEIARRVDLKIQTPIRDEQGKLSEEYFRQRTDLSSIERNTIAEHLPEILNETGGVLLPYILEDVGEGNWNLADRIGKLEPVTKSLLSGSGPMTSTLLPLEEEAIGLVYCVTVDLIRTHWHDLTKDNSTNGLRCSDSPFYMQWKRKELTLTRPLDISGFKVFDEAVIFAQHFNRLYRTDIDSACLRLSPRRLEEPARDTSTLAKHLGILLAISGVLEGTNWNTNFFKGLKNIENHTSSYDQVARLSNLFSIELRDAVIENVDGFLFGLSSVNRQFLASRIVVEHQRFGESAQGLREIISYMLDIVTQKYLAWAERERNKFRHGVSEQCKSQTYGVISKHPASFFAPIAVGICTGGDLALWREARFSLFLIFDEKEKHFAGMVYLFTHVLKTDCGERPILVARAFNMMPSYIAGFDPYSMVESIICALISYAKREGFSALALPEDSGQHLLSNNVAIEKAIKQRLGKPTTSYGLLSLKEHSDLLKPVCVKTNFAAYSEGREIVNHISIVWKDC